MRGTSSFSASWESGGGSNSSCCRGSRVGVLITDG